METESSDNPSRDLTFEWVRASVDELSRISDTLSIRATGILATGSLIIGVTASTGDIQLGCPLILFSAAIVFYLMLIVSTLAVLLPRPAAAPADPTVLREDYWQLNPDKAVGYYYDDLEQTYKSEHKAVRGKGRWLLCSVICLAVEVLLLLAAILVPRISSLA